MKNRLQPGDVEEALKQGDAKIGDNMIQRKMTGRIIIPDAFTHGTAPNSACAGSKRGSRAGAHGRLRYVQHPHGADRAVRPGGVVGDRVAVLGSNGSGKSHSSDSWREVAIPDLTTAEALTDRSFRGTHRSGTVGRAGATGVVRADPRAPRAGGRTLLEILAYDDGPGRGCTANRRLRGSTRYELTASAQEKFETLSGGQQARFQILLLELAGSNLLLLDEPTDNLDVESAEALEAALDEFEGTVLAVTHDRWFSRSFDRFLVFGADGLVRETDQPVWDEDRVDRPR